MNQNTRNHFAVALAAALGCTISTGHAGDVRLNFEAPENGSSYSGVSNLRGYALSSAGIARVELYIDDTYATDIPYGAARADVGNAFPSYPGAATSGFSMAYNMNKLSNGSHKMMVRAVDNDGTTQEASASFTVNGFHAPFFSAADAVDMTGASVTGSGNAITLHNVSVDGQNYDIRMVWRAEAQGFQFSDIAPGGTL